MSAESGPNHSALSEAISQLIIKYGQESVLREARSQSVRLRGRPRIDDDLNIADLVAADAQDVIDGRDYRARITNNAIAARYAGTFPAHQREAVQKRVNRKLREGRASWALLTSYVDAIESHPIETCRRIAAMIDAEINNGEHYALRKVDADVARHTSLYGSPSAEMTFAAVQEAVGSA